MIKTLDLKRAVNDSAHPSLIANPAEIRKARKWLKTYRWYRGILEQHRSEIDRFLEHRPIFVSAVKQTYQYKMYTCPNHDVELLYEEFRPHEHRCPVDQTEVFKGEKYDSAWSGWYNRLLASHLVWMGILYQVYAEERYAEAAREILVKFAELYLQYPTENTILGPAHVFFGTLSESFWGVDMAYGYDLVHDYEGFTKEDREKIKENLFYPLANITQQFPESASNRQLWYNNVSAAVGFLYQDRKLLDFAIRGEYGFEWQLGSALPESGFWAEGPGYHFVALRGMIHLAEMARHHGLNLYRMEIAGRSMKRMFDAPFEIITPNYEFPRIKDSGGGSLFEYAPFYEVGYAVFEDPKYLSLLNLTTLKRGTQVVGEESGLRQQRSPITLFNLVPNLPGQLTEIYPERSLDLKGNGFAVLRNGEGRKRRYLYLDYGILGGEHGHPDRLQLGYYAQGRNWIVDPLNESYFNPNLQLWYRQTIAHNTVVLNQSSQTWANGKGIFFGALPELQIACGGSQTIYPGAKLRRTLLQLGDYFIDLFDVTCREKRTIDWPLHSFGQLKILGVKFERRPSDLFGRAPGIPGYDQLTELHSGKTDHRWEAVFESEEGERLLVKAIGEIGTEVFQAITPPLGGFYKQMVKDPKPMPMLFSRRITQSTRFAHLVHAYGKDPTVLSFEEGREASTYVVHRSGGEDLLYVDVERSKYWVLKKEGHQPSVLSGFRSKEVEVEGTLLFYSDSLLAEFEIRWNGKNLSVLAPAGFGQLRIWGPKVSRVELNGKIIPFKREGEFILLQQKSKAKLQLHSPDDTKLYLGRSNRLSSSVRNYGKNSLRGRVKLTTPSEWKEQVKSQIDWWGGIVNLKAMNKRSVQRQTFPKSFRQDPGWVKGLPSRNIKVLGGKTETINLKVPVPNDVPPVTHHLLLNFGKERLEEQFRVVPPITADLLLPNGLKETLWVTLKNHTTSALEAALRLEPHSAWRICSPVPKSISLGPEEEQRVEVPIKILGYNPESQLYPVRLRIGSGAFRTELTRDFYVGEAYFAAKSPSLDGTWDGWVKRNPMTIDKSSQVCKLLMGNQPWNGPRDLSARIYAMYDKEYLYIGAEVVDDVVVSHWNFPFMSYPWDTDSMEIIIDSRTNSEQGNDPPTPGLFRQLCSAEFGTTESDLKNWQGGAAGGPLLPRPLLIPGAKTYFRRTPQGYNVICRFPLASLPDVVAEPGFKIGFDVAINDNDGTAYRKNQHIWAGFTQNQSWWDVGTIGALVFKP